jgi:hypothetical protein
MQTHLPPLPAHFHPVLQKQQVMPLLHPMPQPVQSSLEWSTHLASQHSWFVRHGWSQAPQWLGSLFRSTHPAAPQHCVGSMHVCTVGAPTQTQLPLTQLLPSLQLVAQLEAAQLPV